MTPKKFFFVLLGIIGGLLAAGGYGYYYGLQELSKASQNLAQQLGKQDAAASQLNRLITIKRTYELDVVPLMPRMNAALPQTKNQSELLALMEQTARSAGASLSKVSFSGAPGLPSSTSQTIRSGNVLAIPISFEVRGSYGQLQNFLVKIENLSRLTTVGSISLNRNGNTSSYSISINAYMKP